MNQLYSAQKRKNIMLCYPFSEKRLAKWGYPVITQPKLDGDRCRAVSYPGAETELYTSEENVRTSVPHVLHQIKQLRSLYCDEYDEPLPELDGELYHHGTDHDTIRSIVSRTKNLHAAHETIELHIFDLCDETINQLERLQLLMHRIGSLIIYHKLDKLRIVKPEFAHSFNDVYSKFESYCNKGYEGIILRNPTNLYVRKRSTNMMKFKPKKDDYYEITGYEEERDIYGEPKNSLGSLLCTSGDDNQLFNVGSGFTSNQRKQLWRDRKSLPGKIVRISYQHLTPGRGVPLFPVFMEVPEDE